MSTSHTFVLVDCLDVPRARAARERLSSVLPDADASANAGAWQTLPQALLATQGGAPGQAEAPSQRETPGQDEAPRQGDTPCLILTEFAHDALAAAMAEGRPPRAALSAWMKSARDTLALCERHPNARIVTLRQAESDPAILTLATRHLNLPFSTAAIPPRESTPIDPVATALAQAALSLERKARELNAGLIRAALLEDPVRRSDRPDPDRAYKAYRAMTADALRAAATGDLFQSDGAASDSTSPGALPGDEHTPLRAPELPTPQSPSALTLASHQELGSPIAPAIPLVPASPADGDLRVRFDTLAGDKILAARLAEVEARNEVLIDQVAELQDALHRAVVDPVSLAFETVFCDEAFNHPAFYGTERRTRDALPFRWFGQEAEAVIRTTVPRQRPVCVEAHLAVVIRRSALDGFDILLADAVPVAREVNETEDGTILVRAYFEAADVDPLARLTVVLKASDLVDMSDKGDARRLAVGLHKITVAQLEDLPPAYRQSGQVELTATDALALPAFYGAEELSGIPFRWMGREDDTVIRADIVCRGPMAVEVHMPVVLTEACVEAVTLSLNGFLPERQTIDRDGSVCVITAWFETPLQGTEFAAKAGATVVLSAPEKVDMQGSDGRALSVAVHKVVVRSLAVPTGDNAPPLQPAAAT